jgi:hypothetical protein
LKYAKHGRRRAAERSISENVISKAVSEPSFSFYDLTSAAHVVFKKLNGKHLLVVYACEENEIRVISILERRDIKKL